MKLNGFVVALGSPFYPSSFPHTHLRLASLFSFYFKDFFFFLKRKQGTAGVAKFIFSSHGDENTFTAGGGLRACKQLEQAPRPGRVRTGSMPPGRARGAAAAHRRWWGAAGPGRAPRGLYSRGGGSGGACVAVAGGSAEEVERRGALSRRPRRSEATRLPGRGAYASPTRGSRGTHRAEEGASLPFRIFLGLSPGR